MNASHYLQYYLNYFFAKFQGYPLIIQITVVCVTVLAIVSILTLLRMLFVGRSIHRYEKRKDEVFEKYETKFSELFYSPQTYSLEEIEARIDLKTPKLKNWEIEIFTKLLLFLKSDAQPRRIEELNKENFATVLDILGLYAYWEKHLSSSETHKRQRAFRKLEGLSENLSGASILRSVYHRDDDLRKQARAAFIKYDYNEPFKFLEEDFDRKFNRLDELRLHDTLLNRSKEGGLPLLMRWVNHSANPAYKCFMIKEIGFFQQQNGAPFLLELYKETRDEMVQRQIIETLGVLNYEAAQAFLMEEYGLANIQIQHAIIEALGKFNTVESLEFLEQLYDRVFNHDTKIKIAQAIHESGEEGKALIETLQNLATGFDKKIFAQISHASV